MQGEGRASVLTGFEITGGSGHFIASRFRGGGVFAFGAEPTIRENTIVGNFATSLSGGVNYGYGGGLYFVADSPPVFPLVEENTIWYNKAGLNGGGIACDGNVAPVIRNNVIMGNECLDGDGAGIWLLTRLDGAVVEGNRIEETCAGDHGGGILIAGERSSYPYVSHDAEPPGTIRNNLAWQNEGGDGTGSCPTWWETEGNVAANPHFCGPEAGDYTVAQNSPALLHPAGPIGALGDGCGPVAVKPTTWGRIKSRYR